jgi:hypothetical protein
VLFDRTLDQLRRPFCRGQVNGHGGDALEPVESTGGPRAGDDMRALGRQRLGDGEADALARAGDHRHLAVEIEVHRDVSLRGTCTAGIPARRAAGW